MSIKIDRARKLSVIGQHPEYFDMFIKSVPADVIGINQ